MEASANADESISLSALVDRNLSLNALADSHLSLCASQPPLTAFPQSCESLRSLIGLDISRNQIEELPSGLDVLLPMLQVLDASRNRLRVLPTGLPSSLTTLRLLSNKLRPVDRSLPHVTMMKMHKLSLLDLRFNPKLKGTVDTMQAIMDRLPGALGCEILLTEPQMLDPKPSAATRDQSCLRCQLEPLSTPQIRSRLASRFGEVTDPDASEREDLLLRLVACYEQQMADSSLPRPLRRIAGTPLGAIGTATLPKLLAELRATVFPGGSKRERPKIKAQGYIILQKPPPGVAPEFDPGLEPDNTEAEEAGGHVEEVGKIWSGEVAKDGCFATTAETALTAKARLSLAKLRRHARIWTLAARIMREADPEYARRYTALAVTKQFEGSPHIDTENVAPFYGLGLGEYTGGFICVESEDDGMHVNEVDTQGRLGRIDGRYPHWVAPHAGERYSIIYYQTAGEAKPMGPSVFADEQPESERRL